MFSSVGAGGTGAGPGIHRYHALARIMVPMPGGFAQCPPKSPPNSPVLPPPSSVPLISFRMRVKLPAKVSIGKSLKESETLLPEKEGGRRWPGGGQRRDAARSSCRRAEAVEVEEVIESRGSASAQRPARVDGSRGFSKRKMEKTKVRTQRKPGADPPQDKENLEKTRHPGEAHEQAGHAPGPRRRPQLKTSLRTSCVSPSRHDHVVYARSKTRGLQGAALPTFPSRRSARAGGAEGPTEMVEVSAEEEGAGARQAADLLRGQPRRAAFAGIEEEWDAVLVDKSDSD